MNINESYFFFYNYTLKFSSQIKSTNFQYNWKNCPNFLVNLLCLQLYARKFEGDENKHEKKYPSVILEIRYNMIMMMLELKEIDIDFVELQC